MLLSCYKNRKKYTQRRIRDKNVSRRVCVCVCVCVYLADAWRTVFPWLCCVNSEMRWASVMVWGCFSWFGLGPFVLVNGNMSSEINVQIVDNSMLPTLWKNFGLDLFFFNTAILLLIKEKVIASWFEDSRVDVT